MPTEPIVCSYPRLSERDPFPSLDATRLATANEAEPNNNASEAQSIPLGFSGGGDQDVDIDGVITPFDHDFFKFNAERGDVLGVAVLAVDADRVDSRVAVLNDRGEILVLNEDHQIGSAKIADLYPPESPLPAGGLRRDSLLSFVAPDAGTYLVRVNGSGASSGKYRAQFRLRKPAMRGEPAGSTQVLFLDFDGATIDAKFLFGDGGRPTADLTPFQSFLQRWGIPANREDAMIDAISAAVREHFDELIARVGQDAAIVVQNSKDDADEFGSGNPYVSRVIVGGTIAELGIGTIGIAECIDPGNFSFDDTAVVLLDLLSAPSSNQNSILSLPREQDISLEEAVVRVVAAVISHEAGHYLGCWHTHNSNDVHAIMDRGGSLQNTAGVGADGVLGSDDPFNRFAEDLYAAEGVGRSVDREEVGARVAAALAVGAAPSAPPGPDATEALLVGLEAQRDHAFEFHSDELNAVLASLGLAVTNAEPKEAADLWRIEKAIDTLRHKRERLPKLGEELAAPMIKP